MTPLKKDMLQAIVEALGLTAEWISSELIEYEEVDESTIKTLAAQAEEFERTRSEPDVEKNVEISEEEIEPAKLASINLWQEPARNFDELIEKAPMDRFIEEASKRLANANIPGGSLFSQAVCVAYHNIPQDQWGTNLAENIIKGLLETHEA